MDDKLASFRVDSRLWVHLALLMFIFVSLFLGAGCSPSGSEVAPAPTFSSEPPTIAPTEMLEPVPYTPPVGQTLLIIGQDLGAVEWYAPFFDYAHKNRDVVRAVAYINVDWNSQTMWEPGVQGYWGDSRVQTNVMIKERWLAEISSDFWVHGSPGLFELLKYDR